MFIVAPSWLEHGMPCHGAGDHERRTLRRALDGAGVAGEDEAVVALQGARAGARRPPAAREVALPDHRVRVLVALGRRAGLLLARRDTSSTAEHHRWLFRPRTRVKIPSDLLIRSADTMGKALLRA